MSSDVTLLYLKYKVKFQKPSEELTMLETVQQIYLPYRDDTFEGGIFLHGQWMGQDFRE